MNKEFERYTHIRRLGTEETEGIGDGTYYVFPKLDGTNASAWLGKDMIAGGSRGRRLTLESDNSGFYRWLLQQPNMKEYLEQYPNRRLYGEWLVPHTLRIYREDAWRRFWIFDVTEDRPTEDGFEEVYLPFEEYHPSMSEYGLDYISLIAKCAGHGCPINQENIDKWLAENLFLVDTDQGPGEGIVIKNYEHRSKFDGKLVYAKAVAREFKEASAKKKSFKVREAGVEDSIISVFCTKDLVDKTHAKIVNDKGGWDPSMIPRLLETVFHDMVSEDIWAMVKRFKSPTVDFRVLRKLSNDRVKKVKENLF